MASEETAVLFRPVGPKELALIEQSGWTKFPPRLPEQPIFYPVLNRQYAAQIASTWNVRESGAGFVTQFQVRTAFLDKYEVHRVGGPIHLEYWIPAEDLQTFNESIVGAIQVVEQFGDFADTGP